jgi:small conductance mechanosensitive channel
MEYDFSPIIETIISLGLKVIAALIIFAIGRWLAGWISRWVRRTLDSRGTDEAVARLLTTLTRITVLMIALVLALSTVGIQTTALAALVAALGLAIGLALQGALANFAGGVLILTFHPFRIGDLVEVAGITGIVDDIQLVSTVLDTKNGSKVIVPNGQVSNSTITNFSATGIRRVDLIFGISYDDDLQKAKAVLTDLIEKDDRILKDPAPTIRVLELGESSVNFAVRPFVQIADYWDVYFDLTEQVKLSFDVAGLSMPYPQQDIHLIQSDGASQ